MLTSPPCQISPLQMAMCATLDYRVRAMSTPASARTQPPAPAIDPAPRAAEPAPKIAVTDLNVSYGTRRVLYEIALKIRRNEVTALIGPSGCGKSTFLRTLNRMNDIVPGTRVE